MKYNKIEDGLFSCYLFEADEAKSEMKQDVPIKHISLQRIKQQIILTGKIGKGFLKKLGDLKNTYKSVKSDAKTSLLQLIISRMICKSFLS